MKYPLPAHINEQLDYVKALTTDEQIWAEIDGIKDEIAFAIFRAQLSGPHEETNEE